MNEENAASEAETVVSAEESVSEAGPAVLAEESVPEAEATGSGEEAVPEAEGAGSGEETVPEAEDAEPAEESVSEEESEVPAEEELSDEPPSEETLDVQNLAAERIDIKKVTGTPFRAPELGKKVSNYYITDLSSDVPDADEYLSDRVGPGSYWQKKNADGTWEKYLGDSVNHTFEAGIYRYRMLIRLDGNGALEKYRLSDQISFEAGGDSWNRSSLELYGDDFHLLRYANYETVGSFYSDEYAIGNGYTLHAYASPAQGGRVSFDGNGVYSAGQTVRLTAKAASGYHLSAWHQVSPEIDYPTLGGGLATSISITLSSDTTICAVFERDSITNINSVTGTDFKVPKYVGDPVHRMRKFTSSPAVPKPNRISDEEGYGGRWQKLNTSNRKWEDYWNSEFEAGTYRYRVWLRIDCKPLIMAPEYMFTERTTFRADGYTWSKGAMVVAEEDPANFSAGWVTYLYGNVGSYISREYVVRAKTAIKDCTVTIASATYTGKALKPKVTVKDGSYTLKAGTDYTLAWSNNINAGTRATVKITGKGGYTGTVTKYFTIKPASIAKAVIGKVTSKAYTGKAIKPVPAVKLSGKTLTRNTDYTFKYSNNIKVGRATIIATGKGNYTGTVKSTFVIRPRQVIGFKVTSKISKTLTLSWSKRSEATGYEIQIASNAAFTKKVTTKKVGNVAGYTVKKRSSVNYTYCRVRSYTKVGKTYYYGNWSKTIKMKAKR